MRQKLAPVDIFEIRSQTNYRRKLTAERQNLWGQLRGDPTMYLTRPQEHVRIAERIRTITNTLNGHDSDINAGMSWVNIYHDGGSYADKREDRMKIEVHEGVHESFLSKDGLFFFWVRIARPDVWKKYPHLQGVGFATS